jgi:hypothetical protein
MWLRHAIAVVGLLGSLSAAGAEDFHIANAVSPKDWDPAQLKPGIIVFSDAKGGAAVDAPSLTAFADWAHARPAQMKFLALFPGYAEPTVNKVATAGATPTPVVEKLTMYVAQARFLLDRPPGALDLARYVTLPFLENVDPAVQHKAIAAADVNPLTDVQGTGNQNPQRKWCTGRPVLVCTQSSYRLEGKIPIGILLVNKLRDSAKKASDHIDFESEFSLLAPADLDPAGLKELTGLDAPIAGALAQNIFYVNQIMKFGKFFAVFQADPADAAKTVVTAYMALAIEAGVLDKKKEYEKVPVLRNLVPAQVLMGESSFNSGNSISAGLPKYARNEIATVADLLAHGPSQ